MEQVMQAMLAGGEGYGAGEALDGGRKSLETQANSLTSQRHSTNEAARWSGPLKAGPLEAVMEERMVESVADGTPRTPRTPTNRTRDRTGHSRGKSRVRVVPSPPENGSGIRMMAEKSILRGRGPTRREGGGAGVAGAIAALRSLAACVRSPRGPAADRSSGEGLAVFWDPHIHAWSIPVALIR